MTVSLLFSPLTEFFERVPLGRILNRLSKDMTVLDNRLAWFVNNCTVDICNLIGTPILMIYASSIYILIPLALFFLLCYRMQQYYMNANREIVRLSKYYLVKKKKLLQDPL